MESPAAGTTLDTCITLSLGSFLQHLIWWSLYHLCRSEGPCSTQCAAGFQSKQKLNQIVVIWSNSTFWVVILKTLPEKKDRLGTVTAEDHFLELFFFFLWKLRCLPAAGIHRSFLRICKYIMYLLYIARDASFLACSSPLWGTSIHRCLILCRSLSPWWKCSAKLPGWQPRVRSIEQSEVYDWAHQCYVVCIDVRWENRWSRANYLLCKQHYTRSKNEMQGNALWWNFKCSTEVWLALMTIFALTLSCSVNQLAISLEKVSYMQLKYNLFYSEHHMILLLFITLF